MPTATSGDIKALTDLFGRTAEGAVPCTVSFRPAAVLEVGMVRVDPKDRRGARSVLTSSSLPLTPTARMSVLLPVVSEGKSAKNRMYIDIRVAGPGPWDMAERARLIRQKVPELVAAGATVIREELYDDVLGHIVMQDSEGNEFCVA